MTDVTPQAAPAAAPAQPSAAPEAPKRMRLSDMQFGLEQANQRQETREQQADVRALETERRLARDPQQVPEPQRGADPGELEAQEPPEQPEAEPQQAQPADAEETKFLDAVKQWRETGEMSPELDKMPLEWVDKNGNLVRETIGGLKERGMRLSDYHRGMNEMRARHQEMDIVRTNVNRHFEAIRDPQTFLEEYEQRGYEDTLEQVALLVARRKTQDKQIAEAAGHRMMQLHNLPANHPDVVTAVRDTMKQLQQNRRVAAENKRLAAQNAQLAQMRQQHEQQTQTQVRLGDLKNSLAQLIPRAFQSAGVRNSPANVDAFYRHLNSYVTNIPNWDGNIRRQDCVIAAQMLKEELDDDYARRRPKPAPKPAALPPGRMAQSGSAQPTSNQRKRVSDMAGDPRFGFGGL